MKEILQPLIIEKSLKFFENIFSHNFISLKTKFFKRSNYIFYIRLYFIKIIKSIKNHNIKMKNERNIIHFNLTEFRFDNEDISHIFI